MFRALRERNHRTYARGTVRLFGEPRFKQVRQRNKPGGSANVLAFASTPFGAEHTRPTVGALAIEHGVYALFFFAGCLAFALAFGVAAPRPFGFVESNAGFGVGSTEPVVSCSRDISFFSSATLSGF